MAPAGCAGATRSSGLCVTGLRNGIIARSLAPTSSSELGLLGLAPRVERRTAVLVLLDPRLGEAAVLDLGEDLLHLLARLLVHDADAGDVVAVLGGVADRVAHVVEAAAIHQVDDQLQLVQALEVGDLGLVAGLDERLEARLDQFGGAAAEDGLLAEEIGLGLFGERRLEDARRGSRRSPCRTRAPAPSRCRWRPGGWRRAPARRRPPRTPRGRGGRAPSARPSRRRPSSGGWMVPKRMLKPCANISVLPGPRCGSMSFL